MIIAPSRELVIQIYQELKNFESLFTFEGFDNVINSIYNISKNK